MRTLGRVPQKAAAGLREKALNWGQESGAQSWAWLHLAVVCTSASKLRSWRPVNFCGPELRKAN